MHAAHAELSTVATTLDDLVERVTAIAEASLAAKDEVTASELFEVERALRTAARRLAVLQRRDR
jgi:hypothetical protein